MTNPSAAPGPTVAKRRCFGHHARPVVTVLRPSRGALPLRRALRTERRTPGRGTSNSKERRGKERRLRQCHGKFPGGGRKAAVSEADAIFIRGVAERIARPWLWHWHSPYAIPIMDSPTEEDPKRRPFLTCYGTCCRRESL